MKQDYAGKRYWLIGASSGIGEALARELSARGATLALSARREDSLVALNQSLGGGHGSFALDVSHDGSAEAALEAIVKRFGVLDGVIFLAAHYQPMVLDALEMEETRRMVEVNLMGAFHVLHAALPYFYRQGKGQIVLCGSVAGYTGLPGGQPYSGTKAAIQNLAESLHAEATPRGLDIKLISPGFVKTPLTDKNAFPMPMITTPENAARAIAEGLLKPGFEIHFPKRFTLLLKLLRLLPYRLALAITARFRG
ncbi:MAG: SDR family NAD(P)-dependent oxidoreductase [Alphaproteobacteria bacterium]|nr:SDR family NAD(P)-dependent oxidoreductase [Alphaproteobacteria bacterium]